MSIRSAISNHCNIFRASVIPFEPEPPAPDETSASDEASAPDETPPPVTEPEIDPSDPRLLLKIALTRKVQEVQETITANTTFYNLYSVHL